MFSDCSSLEKIKVNDSKTGMKFLEILSQCEAVNPAVVVECKGKQVSLEQFKAAMKDKLEGKTLFAEQKVETVKKTNSTVVKPKIKRGKGSKGNNGNDGPEI